MNFAALCTTNAVREGGMGLFQVGRKSGLLVWPAGGELKADRGRCPHRNTYFRVRYDVLERLIRCEKLV